MRPTVKGAVVLNELGKGHGAVEIHVHPGVEHPGHLAQDVVFRATGLVQVAVDHIAPLAVQNGIVAEDNVNLSVVDLVEVGDGFKIAIQLPGVFKAGVVVAPDQVLMAPEPGQGVPGHQAPVIAHVPHHIHGVLLRNGLVPPVDELAVHVLHGVEGPGGQKGFIVKMQVGGIEDHGVLPIDIPN